MPATADRVKVANARHGVTLAQHSKLKPSTPRTGEMRTYARVDALTGKVRGQTSAEELFGVGEADGEFGVEGVGNSVEGGEAGGDAAAFESGDGGCGHDDRQRVAGYVAVSPPDAVGACTSGRHVGVAVHGGCRDALRSRGGWVGPAASGRVGDDHSRVAGAVGQELAVVVGTRLIEDRSIAKMVRSGRAAVRKAG